jgi:3-oxoacyl-[acyl-carrier-protein] synthase-1
VRLAIVRYTATCAAGVGLASLRQSLQSRRSGLRENDLFDCDLDTWIGRVDGVEEVRLPDRLSHLQSRNNQLAWLGLQQDGLVSELQSLVDRIGAHRIGVIMGTSTSSIGRTEQAYLQLDGDGRMHPDYRQPQVHNLHSAGAFVAAATGLKGPSITISTACSSSAKVFATATRWIRHGLIDAALVGGIDSLCLSTLYGFNSLELISNQPCRPFDLNRNGISIGEAAGYALVCRADLDRNAELALLGYGESSDAHHMSHPHPEGKGAVIAMSLALQRAGLPARSIDYVNLHGTASKANDRVETYALAELFDDNTVVSSTKAWTGHTLGAAGILEAVITMDTLETGLIPGTLNREVDDPEFRFDVLGENVEQQVACAMSNSFGFGGNNASLIFGRSSE